MKMLGRPARVLGVALLLGGIAVAADQQMLGKKLIVKDPSGDESKRSVIGLGKEKPTDVSALSNPSSGATLQIIANGTSPSNQTFSLPAAGWSAIGNGFKYIGSVGGEPVKKVVLKRTPAGTALIKIIVKGSVGSDDLVVLPPNTGTDGGFILDVTGGDRYCVSFGGAAGGTTVKDDGRQWKVINATAEPGCPTAQTTTSTSSTTSTTIACASVGDGMCANGFCPGGQICLFISGACGCLPTGVSECAVLCSSAGFCQTQGQVCNNSTCLCE
jgi:hypothetical protein